MEIKVNGTYALLGEPVTVVSIDDFECVVRDGADHVVRVNCGELTSHWVPPHAPRPNDVREIDRATSDYDFAAYQQGTKEERLRIIQDVRMKSTEDHQKAFYEGMMFADSVGLENHPKWFDFGCACDTCLSYGE